MSKVDIKRIIITMKSKSCELDPTLTTLLKDMQPILLLYLTEIINKSLTEEMFIERWKTVTVKPLLQKLGFELIKEKCRPVNNLSLLSKVVERCVLEQFNSHSAEFYLLPDFHSTYRQNYSTETSLLKMVNDPLWGMERKQVTAVAILDLSTPFDTVDHKLLQDVLQKRFWNMRYDTQLM